MHLISGLGYRICKFKYFKKMARKRFFHRLPRKTFFHGFRAWVSADSAGFRCELLLCFANIISRILKLCSKKYKSALRNCFVSYDNSFFYWVCLRVNIPVVTKSPAVVVGARLRKAVNWLTGLPLLWLVIGTEGADSSVTQENKSWLGSWLIRLAVFLS